MNSASSSGIGPRNDVFGTRNRSSRLYRLYCGYVIGLSVLTAGCAPSGGDLQEEQSLTTKQLEGEALEEVNFPDGPYFQGICESGVEDLSFNRFESTNYIYGTPTPVKVSGGYFEILGPNGATASSKYEEVHATIFRDLEFKVLGQPQAGQYSFEKWAAEFGVSDFPFFPENQITYKRALGAEFPMLPLSSLDISENSGDNFDINFVSVVNVLKSGSSETEMPNIQIKSSEEIAENRLKATGVKLVRDAPFFEKVESAIGGRPFSGELKIGIRGRFLIFQLDDQGRTFIAINLDQDKLAIKYC